MQNTSWEGKILVAKHVITDCREQNNSEHLCKFFSVALSQTSQLLGFWATAGKWAHGAAPGFGTNTVWTNPVVLGGGGLFLFLMVEPWFNLVQTNGFRGVVDIRLHQESFQGC